MTYKQIKVYSIAIIFTASQRVWAESAASTVQVSKQAQKTPIERGMAPQAQSLNGSATQSKGKNSSASTIATVVGAGLMVTGGIWATAAASGGPTTAWKYTVAAALFAMGTIAFQQASNNKKSAQGSADTSAKTASGMSWGNLGENMGGDPLADPAIRAMIDVDKVKASMEQAKKMGIDGKSPVKINGKDYKPSDFSSAESMAAAGLPKDLISSAMGTAAKLEKEAMKRLGEKTQVAAGYEEGGGVAAQAVTASQYNSSGDDASSVLGHGRVARDPASVSVAGLTKNFNGDPIGVSADSIFQMMTRRYKLKERQNSFIDGATVNLQK